jgi:hypothetical protein
LLWALILLAVLVSGIAAAMADEGHAPAPTPVGPTTAPIAELNYDESGGAINGFLVGKNTLLAFQRPVCGGVGTLGSVGDSVTYSGLAETLPSGFQLVNVTSFTNGTITYPPIKNTGKLAAFALTAGTITQLNHDPESGSVDGFVFTPASGPVVLLALGHVSSTLAPQLTTGAAVSVTGTTSTLPFSCPPAGSLPEVYASALTIGNTTYQIGGGPFRPPLRDLLHGVTPARKAR